MTAQFSTREPPPGTWRPLRRAVERAAGFLDHFLHVEAASGIALLLAAAIALSLANSGWGAAYADFWHTTLAIQVGAFTFARSLEWFVNDGLMVIFFFVVGLEIRRELHAGELSQLRRAALPIVAALGGVIAPAGIYLLVANHPDTRTGWAVPTATDIAFAVGVMALLGRRAPPALRVLLLALAVIDDLAAIIIIAVFYSGGIAWTGLVVAALGIAAIVVMRAAGVRKKLAYVPAGVVVWAGTYASGVHPTIAGVVLGLLTPVQAWLGPAGFLDTAPSQLADLRHTLEEPDANAQAVARSVQPLLNAGREAVSPAEGLITLLHPWVAFGIMPLFALANAGVRLGGVALDGSGGAVTLAIVLGLVLGKPIGIVVSSAAALASGLVELPAGLTLKHVLVLGAVAGIGFTMAIFVAQLAFTDESHLNAAKVGVLAASALAGALGIIAGRTLLAAAPRGPDAATSAHEAECSTVR